MTSSSKDLQITSQTQQKASSSSSSGSSSQSTGTAKIVPMECRRPLFRGQQVIEEPGIHSLDGSNFVMLFTNLLDEAQLKNYLAAATQVGRVTGKSGFGMKPRKEICYTITGQPYKYSGRKHLTKKFPDHVSQVLEVFLKLIRETLEQKGETALHPELSTGVDIEYSSEFPRGGSISEHKDDEEPW
eukprot:CAMPEP_0201547280 /NCGR_PEP_ID=MMETSP0173_2-20130828/3744_1 /ASSEMBLY_ACC=CAM_ASM_000268 /TAXON_ID=218659 /ORGANISM="Vexillifera sp., Strain DIVA3 564/2" /LENGTH=185 /DNA_ID=CAMNT_0047956277 /DNA_START=150 /DNA_END=704 /DNA_ORIENTATION=-